MRTVVIIEPHPLFRLGLRKLLNDALPQLTIEGYDYTTLNEPPNEHGNNCELLLLSQTSSHCTSQLATAALTRFSPTRMLLLSEGDNVPATPDNLPACVAGSVPREAPPEVLQASVNLVLAGGTCFPPGWHHASTTPPKPLSAASFPVVDSSRYQAVRWDSGTAHVSASQAASAAAASTGTTVDSEFSTPIKPGSIAHKESQLLGLTPRQYEVLVLLARGYPMKKVGRELNISVATAKAHTETLYQRLDVHNRNAAVYAAVSRGATLGWAQVRGAHAGTPPHPGTHTPQPRHESMLRRPS